MDQRFYASGKLLITSEYMILHGAKALAVPLETGQSLIVRTTSREGILTWDARADRGTWFQAQIRSDDLSIVDTTDPAIAERLTFILGKAVEIEPGFRSQLAGTSVITELEFKPEWGFGSSSTLTSLIAQWAGIDSMQLHFRISRGSGYDVACASSSSPILYEIINEMPVVESVEFNPPFRDKLWFAYLGKKKESAASIQQFFNEYEPQQEDVEYFSRITCRFLRAGTLEELGKLMEEHEQGLSRILRTPGIREDRFQDLNGYVKSLGAWGGDFVLIATEMPADSLKSYLQSKKIHILFSFNELIRHEQSF